MAAVSINIHADVYGLEIAVDRLNVPSLPLGYADRITIGGDINVFVKAEQLIDLRDKLTAFLDGHSAAAVAAPVGEAVDVAA